jgi:hypothetical protein
MDMLPGKSVAYVELNSRPNAQLTTFVREFITNFYRRLFATRASIGFIALATHELLENAVRHALDNDTTIRIEVSSDSDGKGLVSIRTWNRASLANITRLTARLNEIAREKDAYAYYQRLIGTLASSDPDIGLGLARIPAETDMQLLYEVDGETVCVKAVTEVRLCDDLEQAGLLT